ncbi:Stearoyl-CoA desaturase 5 like protein [Argiope bruennichi]|uniref:Stearoyl-CoA desaturase 5 like protein n=1 Tax=Argiope bruennichi TaxID=94029 RepID=A0A8T0F9F5_ARGBR|nr:Stearoyl-CoA desaturase 5 like protein [Argiope bruennichi]
MLKITIFDIVIKFVKPLLVVATIINGTKCSVVYAAGGTPRTPTGNKAFRACPNSLAKCPALHSTSCCCTLWVIPGHTECHTSVMVLRYIFMLLDWSGCNGRSSQAMDPQKLSNETPPKGCFFCFFCNCMALQTFGGWWARDHRVHHKNLLRPKALPSQWTRIFFFRPLGWFNLGQKTKDGHRKGKTVDISDVWADPVVRFQHRFYVPLCALSCFIIPAAIPYYCWGENVWVSFFGAGFTRYVVCLHFTWFVNSAAHMWGNKPYDKNISAVETKWVSALAIGEGFHNYHHTFPWDYSTSELGYKYNFTTLFIDCMAYIGQAYDLKTASKESVQQRKLRTGDGSYDELEKKHKD